MKGIKVQAVLFDLDGVLVDSREAISNCANYALEKIGLPARKKEEIYQYIGVPLYAIFKKLLPSNKQNLLDECIKFYRERYEKKSVEETKLIDGIPELLKSLKDKTLVVATVKLTHFSEELLAGFKIKDCFDRIVGSGVIQKELTKSTIVKKALGEIKTNSAVIVGDTKYDIEAGKENGIFTIGVTWGIGSEEELRKAKADFIVHSPKEIEEIVK